MECQAVAGEAVEVAVFVGGFHLCDHRIERHQVTGLVVARSQLGGAGLHDAANLEEPQRNLGTAQVVRRCAQGRVEARPDRGRSLTETIF